MHHSQSLSNPKLKLLSIVHDIKIFVGDMHIHYFQVWLTSMIVIDLCKPRITVTARIFSLRDASYGTVWGFSSDQWHDHWYLS